MVRLVRLAIFAAILWVGYHWWAGNLPKVVLPGGNTSQNPSAMPPLVPAPAPAPPPVVSVPPPPRPAVNPQAAVDLAAQLETAKAAAADKTKALKQATAPVLAILQTQPDYQQAKVDADALQQQVRVARDKGTDDLPTLSAQWIAAKNKVSAMEQTAFDASSAVTQATIDLHKAEHDQAEIEEKIAANKQKGGGSGR